MFSILLHGLGLRFDTRAGLSWMFGSRWASKALEIACRMERGNDRQTAVIHLVQGLWRMAVYMGPYP